MKPEPLAECSVCAKPFMRRSTLHKVCSPRCAIRSVKAQKAQERTEFKRRQEAAKPRGQWLREAQAVVNRYVRLRDMLAGHGCITCGAMPQQKRGGTVDAGHFRSVGSAPHLRFYTPQIALQCVPCNRHQGGRALDFRRALIERRGLEWVEWLESVQGLAKFDVDYLRRLKAVMGKRARRLETRLERAA